MLSPLPRRSGWAHFAHSLPAISAFPERVTGSACASSFSRFARRSLALRPAHSRRHQIVTRYTEGFGYFVTSIAAPVASGWSDRRVGLAPTGKRRLSTAHTQSKSLSANTTLDSERKDEIRTRGRLIGIGGSVAGSRECVVEGEEPETNILRVFVRKSANCSEADRGRKCDH